MVCGSLELGRKKVSEKKLIEIDLNVDGIALRTGAFGRMGRTALMRKTIFYSVSTMC